MKKSAKNYLTVFFEYHYSLDLVYLDIAGGGHHERMLHQCQGGPRGASRRGQSLYEFCPGLDGRRGMAYVCIPYT